MFIQSPDVLESFARFGYPRSLIWVIRTAELVCALLYVIPRTSILGAVLLTGYLGGAVATHVRISDPGFVGPLVAGILIWTGLYLRESPLGKFAVLRNPRD